MKNSEYRLEHDSVGAKEVPIEAYYGVQSLRACENFKITGQEMRPEIINSLAEVKKACAITNMEVKELDEKLGNAIVEACNDVISGKLHDEFIVDPIQGGAGTSANMNANEVIANRAIEILGGKKGDYTVLAPNDHVNMGQSTNDVFPSAGKIAAIRLLQKTIPELESLYDALVKKSEEFSDVIKMGRTQLEDAIPITMGQEFKAYSAGIKRDIKRLNDAIENLSILNLGGTAIGTGLNADEDYVKKVVPNLAKVCNLNLVQAEDLIDGTQNLDVYVYVSGILKSCAVNLSKMSNDLRLMNSGPRTGLDELNLPARQNGSSIMPGKVNPVIPEVVSQVAFNIIGNDMTITMAAEGGQLELNAFEPVLFYNLYESITSLTGAVNTLRDNCIIDITANREHCSNLVENAIGMITAINPYVGYEAAAEIANEALKTKKSIRELILRDKLLSEEELNEILNPYLMIKPGIIGKEHRK